jgi:quinol-cytochrome oxidoreductase complex cytochrome b subunit
LRETALAAWRGLEHGFDAAFGSARNPLRQLGTLGFLMFWLLAVSGIYLYAVLDTSVEASWHSIEQLSRSPWSLGGLLRSLHRYAADAFVLLMLAHLLREWLAGHWSGFRRFSWLTGVPLLLFAFVSAIGGFWLHWDRLGQFSAVATAEWLDRLPLFATPLSRNFRSTTASSRCSCSSTWACRCCWCSACGSTSSASAGRRCSRRARWRRAAWRRCSRSPSCSR